MLLFVFMRDAIDSYCCSYSVYAMFMLFHVFICVFNFLLCCCMSLYVFTPYVNTQESNNKAWLDKSRDIRQTKAKSIIAK